MRELIIPNLNKINLLKDHIITENMSVSIEYEYDDISWKWLLLELTGEQLKLPITIKISPLDRINDTLKGKILDKIENNSFKLVDHTYTIFEEERKIYINCNLQINSKYQKL